MLIQQGFTFINQKSSAILFSYRGQLFRWLRVINDPITKYTIIVSCCAIHYEVCIQTMFRSSLPPVCCFIYIIGVYVRIVVFCFLRLENPMLPVSLGCTILIALRYYLTFMYYSNSKRNACVILLYILYVKQ
jgi:hypothetical protein